MTTPERGEKDLPWYYKAGGGTAAFVGFASLTWGLQAALYNYHNREASQMSVPSVVRAADRDLSGLDIQLPPKETPITRQQQIEKILQERLEAYRDVDHLHSKSWQVIKLPESVTMRATTDIGILFRRVADRRKVGNLVPTFAPGDQPQIKHWKWGEPIRQKVNYLVLEKDNQTGQSVFFAVDEDNNLWPIFDSQDPDSPYVQLSIQGNVTPLQAVFGKPGGF